MKKIFLTLALIGLSSSAFAGGYRVALQGVRQAALGGTSATQTHDASVAFYNPAGLAFVDSKLSIAVGGFGVKTDVKWQDPMTLQKTETDSKLGTPMYLAVSYKPVDDLAIGLSVTTPFGSSVTWPEDWQNKANITHIDLKAFNIQPTVAYRFSDWFSLGVGFIYTHGTAKLEKVQTVAGNDIKLKLEDKDAHGLGFNVGAMFKPTDKFGVGIAYRSNVDVSANKGDVTWSNVPSGIASNVPFNTDKWNTTLPLPSEFTFGMSYKVLPQLETYKGKKICLADNSKAKIFKVDLLEYTDNNGQVLRTFIHFERDLVYLKQDVTIKDKNYDGGGYGVTYFKNDINIGSMSNGVLKDIETLQQIEYSYQLGKEFCAKKFDVHKSSYFKFIIYSSPYAGC